MKTVAHKGDKDVCFDTMGKLMKMGRMPKSPLRFLKASSTSVSCRLFYHQPNRFLTSCIPAARLEAGVGIDLIWQYCESEGKSSTERALALIQLAHPQFRDDLLTQAKQLHLV